MKSSCWICMHLLETMIITMTARCATLYVHCIWHCDWVVTGTWEGTSASLKWGTTIETIIGTNDALQLVAHGTIWGTRKALRLSWTWFHEWHYDCIEKSFNSSMLSTVACCILFYMSPHQEHTQNMYKLVEFWPPNWRNTWRNLYWLKLSSPYWLPKEKQNDLRLSSLSLSRIKLSCSS